MKTTFRDPGVSLMLYQDRILVQGPHGPSIVEGEKLGASPQRAQIRGLSGVYHKSWRWDDWSGPIWGNYLRFCPDCSQAKPHRALRHEGGAIQAKRDITWTCACGKRVKRKITWYPERSSAAPIDPFFGYPLLLQVTVAGQNLWAYNERHLTHLQTYIGAEIRERSIHGKWSMVARLPTWMKLAKNRPKVLGGLKKLETKLHQVLPPSAIKP